MRCPIHVYVCLVRQVSVVSDERKISQLIKEAELNIEAGNHEEAEHQLFQVWGMAKQTRNLTLESMIINLYLKLNYGSVFICRPR